MSVDGMSFAGVLLSCSFHEEPSAFDGFAACWLEALGPTSKIVAHVSAGAAHSVRSEMEQIALLYEGRVFVNSNSIATKWGTAFPMHVVNYLWAQRVGLQYSYFYISSPYLYPLKTGLDKYVQGFDLLLANYIAPIADDWHWKSAFESDGKFIELRRHLGEPDVLLARADGVSISRDRMAHMVQVVLNFYSIEELIALSPVYPIEELIFPLFSYSVFRGASIGKAGARVWETWDREQLSLEAIQRAARSWEILCGKRIPQRAGDPIRNYVLGHICGNNPADQQVAARLAHLEPRSNDMNLLL